MPLEEVARTDGDTLFMAPTGLDVDSEGRIYVADWYAARVAVIGPGGELIRTIGRKGLGPGEFRALRGVHVLPGDSVLAYDPSAARLTVFPPGSTDAARVVNLFDVPGGAPFRVWPAPASDGYVALTRPGFRQGDTTPRMDAVLFLDPAGGAAGEPLRVFPSASFIRVEQGRGFSVMPNPFGHEGFVAVGPERLYLAWSDTLDVSAHDGAGRKTGSFRLSAPAPELTRPDVEAVLADFPPQALGTFGRALEDSAPAHWPAVRGLLADGPRVWLALPSSTGEPREWAAFDEEGNYHGSIFVEPGIEVQAIRAGRVYGFEKDEVDRLDLVVFAIGGSGAGSVR